jgi:hypothetical protein
MLDCECKVLQNGSVRHFVPKQNGLPIPYRQVLRFWREDENFRTHFTGLLRDSEFPAFRWETPPVTVATVDRPFEFVLLNSPGLIRSPDAQSFADQFRSAGAAQQVVTFSNLGNDAMLVVPCPSAPAQVYPHLAAFVREAPSAQVHELWRAVGAAMEVRLDVDPVWLSTAGMGVSWLHIRLDSRPKYYGFAPYRVGQ